MPFHQNLRYALFCVSLWIQAKFPVSVAEDLEILVLAVLVPELFPVKVQLKHVTSSVVQVAL